MKNQKHWYAHAPVNALAVLDYHVQVFRRLNAEAASPEDYRIDIEDAESARAAVAELFSDLAPLIDSLLSHITPDNAMTPQAVMVRRVADSLACAQGGAA